MGWRGGDAASSPRLKSGPSSSFYRKGIRLIFLNRNVDNNVCGNATELRDAVGNPEESSLFFLTALDSFNAPEIGSSGDRRRWLEELGTFFQVRCVLTGP